MIELKLTNEETDMLKDILTNYISDLRMEIADTDRFEFREELKKKKTFINDLIDKLNGNH